ncbi:ethylmalonyl-CoA decarboxylase-like [Meleagris gallopavo]|uniref:ethylmalonyl-CoA decarboxylase-like n=1 Tax=Meleagris gallopavo TaxID=9103 RepID=UPI0012ABC6AA|nr:ethylmalonyl-CoA decarboxylase-like [Meleagris gallopavo]
MTPGSEIRFVHKHMGLVPGWGGAARLVQIVGSRAALQLLSGAHGVDPERALHLGLSEGTLSSSDETGSLEEARAWLSQYTEGPASVIRAVKKVVTAGRELPLVAALRTEKDVFGTVWVGLPIWRHWLEDKSINDCQYIINILDILHTKLSPKQIID